LRRGLISRGVPDFGGVTRNAIKTLLPVLFPPILTFSTKNIPASWNICRENDYSAPGGVNNSHGNQSGGGMVVVHEAYLIPVEISAITGEMMPYGPSGLGVRT
jgi:hypothetical protein